MVFTPKSLHLIWIAATVLTSGCAQIATSSETESPATVSDAQATETVIERRDLSGQDLFQLLLAEIATNRGDYGSAAALYSELSTTYNDVTVTERAVALNQSIGNYDELLVHAEKFARLRPDSPRAQAALTLARTAQGQTDSAGTSLNNWLRLDPDADVSILLAVLDQLSREQLQEYIEMLSSMSDTYPESGSLYYTRSRIEAALGNDNAALQLSNKSLETGSSIQAALFKYQLLEQNGDIGQAGDLIKALYRQYPDNRQIAVQLSRHLFQFEPENLSQMQQLHTRFSRDPVIARSYALAAFQQEEYDIAQAVFQHLQKQGYDDEAHYYLGRIDLINALPDLASQHFESVDQPPYLSSALAEWVGMARPEDEQRLLNTFEKARSEHPDEAEILWRLQASYYQLIGELTTAMQALDEGLIRDPENIPLLYDQAMLATRLDRFDQMENSLLAILEQEPDHTDALNALGYTWADMNKNLDQATEMIDKALAAEPDNAAFQDSKGWLLYRKGQPEEALNWLEKAYRQMENDEVAAHIAEVLWSLGREKEARQYLQDIIRINPESRYIGTLNELFSR